MSKESKTVTLSKDQVKMVQSLALQTLDRVWAKGGIMDLQDQLAEKQGGTADLLMAMYRDAEASKHPVEVFTALAVSYEAELVHLDAKQNNGQKRKVTEVYPSWRPMRTEMKQALQAGIKSKGKTYTAIKTERKAKQGGNAKTPGGTPKTDKPKVSVSPALAAALAAVDGYIVTLDAATQTGFAEYLTSAIVRHKQALKALVKHVLGKDVTTANRGKRRTRAAAAAAAAV